MHRNIQAQSGALAQGASLFVMKEKMKRTIQSLKSNLLDLIILVTVSLLYQFNNHYIKANTAGIPHEFFVCYFNDLMAPMFMLSYSNILLHTVNRKITKLLYVIAFCLFIGAVWEFFAPFIKKGAVWDPFDILCYLIGGLFYWMIQNKKAGIGHD